MRDESILWRRLDNPGHEYARLSREDSEWRLAGTAVFQHERRPCMLDYSVLCDAQWRTKLGKVAGWVGNMQIAIEITVDNQGAWRMNGAAHPELTGCIDLDLNFSPSTNLLPIRRLNLGEGRPVPVKAAWLRFPEFSLEPLEQMYTRLNRDTIRYESSGGTFTVELKVRPSGFVTHYPGFWVGEEQSETRQRRY